MNPPTLIGDTSLTTSINTGRSSDRWMARRTRGSSSGFFLLFIQVPWMTLWLNCARHAGRRLGLACRYRIADAGVVDAVGQDRRAQFRREWQGVIEFDAIEIGQA